MQEAESSLAFSVLRLMRKEPFYAHILSNVTRVLGDHIPTMAVSCKEGTFQLHVNPDFLMNVLNEEQRIGVLKHEVLHLVLKHLFRGHKKDPMLENLSADLVVNQYVDPWPLPEGAILISTFPDLKLRRFETMEYYLKELLKLRDKDASTNFPQSKSALDGLEKSAGNVGSHELWGGQEDQQEERILGRILADAMKKSSKYGSLPDAIRRSVDALLKPPSVSWQQVLKIFHASCGRTVLRTTRRKESKRFSGNAGTRIKRMRKIVVAIDTSGSIDLQLLSAFWSEIVSIHRTGTDIMVLECDAEIQNEYQFRASTLKTQFKGGGGTDFGPVIKWANKHSQYNGLIYFTDGYAGKPPKCRIPILWCVYGEIENTDHLKGRVIRLKEEE
ncbi:MAG: VWA-like domain-containing protein [Cryomorphaceae bacterium]|nr:VWA-like domain-containing protein [Cryomorphaceae bacterium]